MRNGGVRLWSWGLKCLRRRRNTRRFLLGFPTFSSLKTQKTTPHKSEDWNKLSNNEHRFVFKLLKYPNYILDLFPVLRKLCLSAFEQHLLCGPQPCQVNKALINY